MRSGLLTALTALMVMLSGPAQASDWVIKPGDGVGPIKLGMRLTDLEKMLVRRDTVVTKGVIQYTKYGGIEVSWLPTAIQIVVVSPSITSQGQSYGLVTDAGIRVGTSTLQQVEGAYGRNYESRELKTGKNEPDKFMYVYRDRGIGFVVCQGKVISINIWSK